MKMKDKSFLGKMILMSLGFGLCILKWAGILPNADVKEIWYAVGFAYGVGFGTIDWNICRDTWVEGKASAEGGPNE